MNSQQKSELWFFWIHFNEFICHIALLNSIPWIQNIDFSSIFSNEFISWIHNNEIRFMNSDWIQWIPMSELIYLWIHIWIQNLYFWIHTCEFIYSWIHIFISHMNSRVYEFICETNIWTHIMITWIHMYMNTHIWMHIWIHTNYGFIWFFHIWIYMFHEFIYEFGCTKVPGDPWYMLKHKNLSIAENLSWALEKSLTAFVFTNLQIIKTFLTLELSQYRKRGSKFSSSEQVAARARSNCRRLGNALCLCSPVRPAPAVPERGPKSLAIDFAL